MNLRSNSSTPSDSRTWLLIDVSVRAAAMDNNIRTLFLVQCILINYLAFCSSSFAVPLGISSKLKLTQQQRNTSISQTSSDPSTVIVSNNDDAQPPAELASAKKESRSRQGKKAKMDVSHLFREQVDNYPEDEITRALMETPDYLRNLFNALNTPLDPHINFTERVAHYHGDDDDGQDGVREESICRTVTRNIYPREANRMNSFVYVPNNQEFMQVIQAELCQHPDRDCNYLQDSLPYGMTSVCYQKYAYKKLLYLDPLEKRMASDLFRYPSCCACHIRYSPIDLRSSIVKSNATTTTSTTTASELLVDSSIDQLHVSKNQSTNRSHERNPNQTVVLHEDKVYAPIRRK